MNVKGDLIQLTKNGKFDLIFHGCNCFNLMDAGIAKQIRINFPSAYEVDCETIKGDENKLGKYTVTRCKLDNGKYVIICNLYTQYKPGKNFDKNALIKCLDIIAKLIRDIGLDIKVGYPAIGCGIGGGNWDEISKIIDEKLQGINHTFVQYEKKG